MTNPLLRAVQEYIDNESAYVRDVEGEIQVLHRQLEHARVRSLRSAIAALHWLAGAHMLEHDRLIGLLSNTGHHCATSVWDGAQREHAESVSLSRAAREMERAL